MASVAANDEHNWAASLSEQSRIHAVRRTHDIEVNFDIEIQKRAEQEHRDLVDIIPAMVWVALADGSNIYVTADTWSTPE